MEQMFKIPNRLIRQIIADLRKEGQPIGSDSRNGYYWCGNERELEPFINETKSRIYELTRLIKGVRKKFRELDQINLF